MHLNLSTKSDNIRQFNFGDLLLNGSKPLLNERSNSSISSFFIMYFYKFLN